MKILMDPNQYFMYLPRNEQYKVNIDFINVEKSKNAAAKLAFANKSIKEVGDHNADIKLK